MGALLSVEGVRHPIICRGDALVGSRWEQSAVSPQAHTVHNVCWLVADCGRGTDEVDFVNMVIAT